MRPGVRIQEGRNGVVSSRCTSACAFGNGYDGAEFWKMLPGLIASFRGRPARVAAISGTPSVIALSLGIQNSDCQATMLPPASSPPLSSTSVGRSEEHTSELQSRLHLVCRLLLEK